VSRKLPIWLLACLVITLTGGWLFGIVSVAGWVDTFWNAPRHAVPPFRQHYSDQITSVMPSWQKAGLAVGDRVLATNGKPFTGFAPVFDQVRAARPGDRYTVRVAKPDGRVVDVTAPLPPFFPGHSSRSLLYVAILLEIAFPLFCLALGTWVLLARPEDGHAWLVFFILQFVQTLLGRPEHFGGAIQLFMQLWSTITQTGFLVAALLFGMFFPERMALDRRRPWLKWLIVGPLLAFLPLDWFEMVAQAYWIPAFRIFPEVLYHRVDAVETTLGLACVSLMCAGIFHQTFNAQTRDARRRMRILLFGSQLGLTPLLIVIIIAAIRKVDVSAAVPFPFFLTALLLFTLFPLSLAYVVIVQRALDLQILLRQGTQYALARGTVRGLRLVLALTIVYVMFRAFGQRDLPPWIVFIPLGLFLLLRFGIEKRAQLWIDRRFFRESYSVEQLLSELSSQAGQFTETRPLLETVTQRISDTLHVDRLVVLLRTPTGFRLQTAMGVELPQGFLLSQNSNAITAIERKHKPATVYFDRPDSWLLDATEDEQIALRELDAEVLLPLPGRTQLMGVMALGPKRSEQPYSPSDLQMLTLVGTQTGMAIENSELVRTLTKEVAQRERMNRELEIAREVQERLFPQSLPQVPGVQLAAACRAAQGVGGDYFDYMLMGDGRLALAVGDVSGKGISAALLMASLRASLRGQTMQGATNLALVVENVNSLLYDSSAANRYATFFFGSYDPVSRLMRYVNAGHNAPVVLRPIPAATMALPVIERFEVHKLEGGGPVVGMLPVAHYEQCELQMRSGDLLIAYTDGISEAMNPQEEEWSEESMAEEAMVHASEPAQAILEALVLAADRFANGAAQHDDMTLLLMKLE
jgi:sigma-B regulation protein RsbU (phosphoserine phosphatase)